MPDKLALIALEHCSVKLGEHLALNDVSFTLHAGERWVLVGANGAGKSVLLKLLRGDMWPTPDNRSRRQYCLDGECSNEPGHEKHQIAYLGPERQDKYLRYGWNLSVMQVVTTGLFDEDIPLTKASAAQQARVQRILRRFRLWSLRERRILSLSYGQRRRVLLARSLVAQPKLLLLDEVFNGIDATTRQQLRALLENTRQMRTWVLAAHSAEDIPTSATHLARLEHGNLTYAGPIKAAHLHGIRRDVRTRHQAAKTQISKVQFNAPQTAKDEQLLRLQDVALFRDYRPVLQAVSWQVRHGEHWAIMGANGSGKSTLLMLLYGDLHPALGGKIERAGAPHGTPIAEWKRRVGFVSPELQAEHFASGTIEQIVASGRYASVGLNQPLTTTDRRTAKPWLEFFGIAHLRDRGARQVSYGQLRLALMARAMVNKPQLLLLDEPFTGLDPDMHAFVMAMLQRLTETGVQIIMAVHDKADLLPAIQHILRIVRGGAVRIETRQ